MIDIKLYIVDSTCIFILDLVSSICLLNIYINMTTFKMKIQG